MFTPIPPSLPSSDTANGEDSFEFVLELPSNGQVVPITHDGFSIGSSRQCDLSLVDPMIIALHSVIHLQSGAIWIEAVGDETPLVVNGHACRRIALRNNDQLRIGNSELTFRQQSRHDSIALQAMPTVDEDLSLLTAEELCDRIFSEQAMVGDFATGRRAGWEALLRAIETANEETITNVSSDEMTKIAELDESSFDELLHQIQQLNEEITDRTLDLSEREKEVLETTNAMEEAQNRVTQRLDEILDQLNRTDPPNELRASA